METIDYKKTLNLPQTKFPMKANLKESEPKRLTLWKDEKLYEKIKNKGESKTKYILHDGPPYANGQIHLGTALNKILKDIICRYKRLQGYDAAYVPGWDCHGLPIEHKVDQTLGARKKGMSPVEIREECRKYAEGFINIQREDFKRLGVVGEWEKPYLTMDYEYEAEIAKQCALFALNGSLFKGKKPVYWCPSCTTALAEAEIEYYDHETPSIYVKFPLKEKLDLAKDKNTYFLIWTTTPWTIPANLAICLNPDFKYIAVEVNNEVLIVAKDLLESLIEKLEISDFKVLGEINTKNLEEKKGKHPLYDRDSLIIFGNHVTLEAGTGCVHTAPGHGVEDYVASLKYGLDAYSPIDDNGKFTNDVEFFKGQFIFDANKNVTKALKEANALFKEETINHSYPHCWRCKNPVIYRATDQWFISMDKNDLRKRALSFIKDVKWIPSWGEEKIYSMIKNRSDWCVSRQRAWGVPITVFTCKKCKKIHINEEIIDNIYNLIAKHGARIWWEKEAKDFLPANFKCDDCNSSEFEKEKDILDVWFDSGVSHTAVLKKRSELQFPADLYLEGSDQHRGWFHSSLLTSVGNYNLAPYKSVLTHGYVVDGDGKKMSKSIGNVIVPQEIINKHGAEILRLWVASSNYKDDIKISDTILSQLSGAYRKIRNTQRFLLGNLFDFDVEKDLVDYESMLEIDKFILILLNKFITICQSSFETFNFHTVYHALYNFCVVDLSSFYLDIIKDRLYVSRKNSKNRKSAQTSIFYLLSAITKLMSPVFVFTSEEVWEHAPFFANKKASIHLEDFPVVNENWENKELENNMNKILTLRKEVIKELEKKREEKLIGHSLDANVELIVENQEVLSFLENYEKDLKNFFISSYATIKKDIKDNSSNKIEDIKINIKKAEGNKCVRCWNFSQDLDENKICKRCVEILRK